MPRKHYGFTLLEALMVVTIIGILASIAYPSYARHIERTQISDGRAGLLAAAQQLERCYTHTLDYSRCPLSNRSPEGFYELGITADANAFALTASGVAGRVRSGDCRALALDHRGVRAPGGCW